MTHTFEEFLKLLPDCDKFPTADTKPSSVGHQPQQPDSFIPPNLSVNLTDKDPKEAAVIIISAPGAVGKSTVGKAIAFHKNVLFWDLAVADGVGSDSLDGMLMNAISAQRISEFQEYLTGGFQFLVIDALDEGRAKVTDTSFQSLWHNIAKLSQDSALPRFVLLGRTRIAEEAWIELSKTGIDVSILSIEPFDREQANSFIANKSGKSSQPHNDCRDLIFGRLESSINSDSTTVSTLNEDFLHYPPVLDVISTLLRDESNPMVLKSHLENQTHVIGRPSTLLQEVIRHILLREKDKMIQNIKGRLEEKAIQVNWEDWNTLYEIDEQSKRLLASVLKSQIVATPSTLPDTLKSEYEEAVSSFFGEHPFLQSLDSFANTVFQSYLYARALLGYCGSELNTLVTEELLKRDYFPNGLLADFYLSDTLTEQGSFWKINPAHLGILYDSLLSAESTQRYIRLNLDGTEPSDSDITGTELVDGNFEFLWRDSQDIHEIRFQMEVSKYSVISFTRGLRDAFITIPCTVELGNVAPEFQIGPAVDINASTIKINSESLIVGGQTHLRPQEEDTNAVTLEALSCDSSVTKIPTVYGTSKLSIAWPGSQQFPWTQFRAEQPQEKYGDNQTLNEVYRRFKRIATAFRSHSRGSLTRTKQKIEHRRVLQGAMGQALLRQLESDQILQLGDGGSRYFWNSEKADTLLGVTWQDLREWAMPEILREYLSKFIQEHPELY